MKAFLGISVLVVCAAVVYQNCANPRLDLGNQVVGSPSPNTIATKVPLTADEITKRFAEVRELAASDLRCLQNDECLAIPVGHKACGGPAGHLIVSSQNSQLNTIQELAAELTSSQQQLNTSNGFASTCSIELAPNVLCDRGTCRASTATQ